MRDGIHARKRHVTFYGLPKSRFWRMTWWKCGIPVDEWRGIRNSFGESTVNRGGGTSNRDLDHQNFSKTNCTKTAFMELMQTILASLSELMPPSVTILTQKQFFSWHAVPIWIFAFHRALKSRPSHMKNPSLRPALRALRKAKRLRQRIQAPSLQEHSGLRVRLRRGGPDDDLPFSIEI